MSKRRPPRRLIWVHFKDGVCMNMPGARMYKNQHVVFVPTGDAKEFLFVDVTPYGSKIGKIGPWRVTSRGNIIISVRSRPKSFRMMLDYEPRG